jgi:Fe-S oxidoreductase/nitrate reductase gamma subunit
MLSFWEKIIFIFIILLTTIVFLAPLIARYRIIRSGQPEARFNNLIQRIGNALAKVFLQKCTLKNERLFTGLMHVFIFYGALTFDTMTFNHTLEGFFKNFYLFGRTNFGLFFSFLVDLFAILVLLGASFFIIKRFILKPKAYATTRLDSGIIYFLLIVVTLSYLYFEAFAVASHPLTSRLSFVGSALARTISNSGMSANLIASHSKISWWLHILIVFGFIAYVPHSKYLHMLTGPFNVLFRSQKSSGELKPLDLEKTDIFGIEKAADFTWKDFLDAFACMECGRCQDACPAFASDKPLSPKMILFNLERHLLKEKKTLIQKDREKLSVLLPDVYSEGEIWTCTTCGACMHVCPVEIEHIPKIVGIRQSQVLMQSKFPSELNTFFRSIETNSNPWGIGFAKRADWAEGLGIRQLRENPGAEYLFWVGCAGSFDEEGKKIARAMSYLLQKAGIDFAILGAEEKCCGDSARRLGHEYLFQTLASENLELFKKYKIKKIITICPHGYNIFKNEYPKLLDLLSSFSPEEKEELQKIEVIHHVQLLDRLLKKGKLVVHSKLSPVITYHDSCYLGRHNGILNEPREILSLLTSRSIVELKNNREHSFCCGAGGGLMWTEESLGKRINQIRTDEVIQFKPEVTATSCPFCLTMLQDGLKARERVEIKVKDIAQLAAEACQE